MMLIAQVLSFKLLYSIHKKSLVKVKDDTKWVLISFVAGLIFIHYLLFQIKFLFLIIYQKLSIDAGFIFLFYGFLYL